MDDSQEPIGFYPWTVDSLTSSTIYIEVDATYPTFDEFISESVVRTSN